MPHDPFHIVILSASGPNAEKVAEELQHKADVKGEDGWEPISATSTVHTASPPVFHLFLVMRKHSHTA